MNYAVIKIQGHQEVVNAETQNLVVDRVAEKEGSMLKPSVLLTSIDGNVQVGAPTVDFPVELEVIKHQRGDKIYVSKFHSKVRYRKRIGFRPEQSVLKVVKFGEKKAEEKKKLTLEKKVVKKTVRKVTVKKIISKSNLN